MGLTDSYLLVASSSMEPVLKPGDKITVEFVDPDDIVQGMVIVFEKDKRKIVHRVIKISGEVLITAGDNVRKFDKPIHISQVIGKVKGLKIIKPLNKLERFLRAVKRHFVRS